MRKSFSLGPLLLIWTLTVAFCRVTFPDPNLVNLVTVVPMFLPGVMAYVGFGRWRPFLPAWSFAVVLAVLVSLVMLHPNNRRGWYLALSLGLLLPLFHQFRGRWLVRASHEIAKYSYGIYLSHLFALVLGFYLLRGRSTSFQLLVELLTIAVISVATYHLLEKPMIDLGARLAKHAKRRAEARTEPLQAI